MIRFASDVRGQGNLMERNVKLAQVQANLK